MCLNSWPVSHLDKLDPALLNERTYDARNEFGNIFELLLKTRALSKKPAADKSCVLENRLSSELQVLAMANNDKLYSLKRDEKYSRHIIGTDGEWIGFICRWEKQIQSAIHGHPSFAYYQVLEGEFSMDLYRPTSSDTAAHEHSIRLKRGDTIWNRGPKARYDNMVHKVSTTDTPGFTLHLFSEDPNRGQHFSINQAQLANRG